MYTAFINATIFTGTEFVFGKALLLNDGVIKNSVSKEDIPADATIVDYTSHYLVPGFIDLQVYGGGGYLFSNDPSAAALDAMTNALIKSGTTGFLVTLATNSIQLFKKAIAIAKQYRHSAVLGLHLEGPYINAARRGAHLQQHIKVPTVQEVTELLTEAEGMIKMMTLAPEVTPPEVIELLTANGVVVSAGHSNATFNEAAWGFEKGITATTHLFNAMSPLHHRDTGLPGATFLNDSVHASIIADGIHVDYNTLAIAKKVMGERLFLITDAVEENRAGDYIHVQCTDRFTLPDGTLSGSRLTMGQAVKNCVAHAGIPLEEALRMATLYPARVMGSESMGILKSGAPANVVALSSGLQVAAVYINGQQVTV